MNSKNNSKVKLGKSNNSSMREENEDSFEYDVKSDKKKSKCC